MTFDDWSDTDVDLREDALSVLRGIERSLFWLSLSVRLFWFCLFLGLLVFLVLLGLGVVKFFAF
jgi:hypothetical protein